MKVVVCENCGAKYQLDDSDDINAFECSSCAGALKELESFPEKTSETFSQQSQSSESVLVYCKNCGLKYQISKNDDINEFECSSCEGPLDYVSNLNQSQSQASVETVSEYYYEDNQSDIDEIVPIHADPNYSDDEYEIVPIHADPNYYEEDEIIPAHAESVYGDEDEIIPVHAESVYVDEDEIVPVHADPNYSDDEYEIVPVHAESNYSDDYYEEEPIENDGSYQTTLFDVEDLEVSQTGLGDTYISPAYDTSSEVEEIIPIHAEKRYQETSEDIASGFAYHPATNSSKIYSSDEYYEEEYYEDEYSEEDAREQKLVEVTDIPEDEMPKTPIQLKRQALSEEDERLFARVQNEMVFDSIEEYQAFKVARLKYYNALLSILKEEYLVSLDEDFKSNSSVKRLIKKGEEKVTGNLMADESDALVSKETAEIMRANNNHYEPKKTHADLIIIVGLFLIIVSLIYYFIVSQLIYVLIATVLGSALLIYGIYKKVRFNNYLNRGRIIRERLLALPNDFYVFYAVQPPQSKDIINHVVVGPTGVFTIISQRYDSKDYKNKVKSENETDGMLNDSASIQDYRQRKNTLELQTDYDDNQTRFQFGNEEIHFEQNSQIKRKALELNEDLAIFLDKKGFTGIYIEPLIGFVNDDLAILNVILTNEDLFIDELFNKMIRGRRRLDELTVAKIARLLSYYSADCEVY